MMTTKNPLAIPGMSFRNYRGAGDLAPIAAVINASDAADRNPRQLTAGDLSAAYQHMTRCDPMTDILIAEHNGEIIGYGRCWWDEEKDALRLYKMNAFILPGWRRRGIGTALQTGLEERLRTIASAHPETCGKLFQANATEVQAGAQALLAKAGYAPVRYFFHMVRPDLENLPQAPLPDGLEIRPVNPDQYRRIWDSIFEGGLEEWGVGNPDEQAYQEWLSDPHFQPQLWQVAWDRSTDQPAGHVLTYIDENENRHHQRQRGYTEGIGVAPAWRRRGVARALILRSLQAQKDAGMTESALVVDRENASGATRLYEACGFQTVTCDIVYRKKLFQDT